MQMMEEEKRECKEERRKVDPTTTLLRKEKGMVSSNTLIQFPMYTIHYNLAQIKICYSDFI